MMKQRSPRRGSGRHSEERPRQFVGAGAVLGLDAAAAVASEELEELIELEAVPGMPSVAAVGAEACQGDAIHGARGYEELHRPMEPAEDTAAAHALAPPVQERGPTHSPRTSWHSTPMRTTP